MNVEVLNCFLLIIMVYNYFGMMGKKKMIPQVIPFKKRRKKNKEDRQNSENRKAQR